MTSGVGRRSCRPQASYTFPDGSVLHPTPGIEELICDECGAGWHGEPDMDCPWCTRAVIRMREWQAEMTLRPPEVDPDDRDYDGAMRGWGERLAVAVRSGIVTEDQARRAWGRAAG